MLWRIRSRRGRSGNQADNNDCIPSAGHARTNRSEQTPDHSGPASHQVGPVYRLYAMARLYRWHHLASGLAHRRRDQDPGSCTLRCAERL